MLAVPISPSSKDFAAASDEGRLLVPNGSSERVPAIAETPTALGEAMMVPMLALVDWAGENSDAIFAAQDRFDEVQGARAV